jgi:hypothetical protein
MSTPSVPELSLELAKRIRLVRRDVGSLLFHFTRKPAEPFVVVATPNGDRYTPSSGSAVLRKILYEARLTGSDKWSPGYPCVCFTEAPIQEFNAIFSLVEIAASKQEKPRYEPYGIAVSKKWLFAQGGRPVIYDHRDLMERLPDSEKYRWVEYDPTNNIDVTWEREWRAKTEHLSLDPSETLVVVPTREEAFDIVYEFAELETDWNEDGPEGAHHSPRWLAVSLDLFGYDYGTNTQT